MTMLPPPPPAPPTPSDPGAPGPMMPQLPSMGDAMAIPDAQDLRPQAGQPTLSAPSVGGVNAMLLQRFAALQHAVRLAGGELYIYSGARDPTHQAALYNAAVAKHGSHQAARKFVQPPGKSDHDPHAGLQHQVGDGAVGIDVRGDIAIAHKLAPQFGLAFSKGSHPWHLSLALK